MAKTNAFNGANNTIGGRNMAAETLTKTIAGGNTMVEAKINDTEVSFESKAEHLLGAAEVVTLAAIMSYKAKNLGGMKLKGGQFEQPSKSYKGFDREIKEMTYKKNVALIGHTNYIYSRAWEEAEELEPTNELDFDLENLENIINTIQDSVLEQLVELKDKNAWQHQPKKDGKTTDFEEGGKFSAFRGIFNCFKHYGFEVFSIYTKVYYKLENGEPKVVKDNKGKDVYVVEKTLKVAWRDNFGNIFSVEFPFIDVNGFFTNNESKYVGMASIDENQKAKILKGDDKNIELVHCYQYICKQLKVRKVNYDGKEELYDSKYFNDRVAAGRMSFMMQSKLKQILRHAKEMAWQEDEGTPIVWIDKYLSDMSLEQYKRNVFLNLSYEELVKCKSSITGLDLLTGSTAEPGKRVQLAANWKTTIKDGKMYLVRKANAINSKLADHVCAYNMSIPALAKSSAKRQNASTIKSTYQLVNPQTYERKFVGNDFDEKVKNSCLRTMFVAKIGIPAMFKDKRKVEEFRKLGLLPNVNDCFIFSDLGVELLRTYFRKPGTQEVDHYVPGAGAKCIGIGRDKGSITSVMREYVPVVDYVCNNEFEADNLEKALQEIRGESHYTVRKGNTVTFELDAIANPSIGRDNVAELTLQSCKEISNMLDGTKEVMSVEEAAKIDVKALVRSRQFNHTVRIVDAYDWDNTVKTFNNIPIMMEDFFVQPQHDNQFYNKERDNVSLNYHQVIDGMKCLLPSLYYSMLESLDYARIKEYMLCLGVEYIEKDNNTQVIIKNKKDKEILDGDEGKNLMDF